MKNTIETNSLSKVVKKRFVSFLIYAVFITFAFLTVYPLLWMLLTSFKSTVEIIKFPLSLPKEVIFTNYVQAVKLGKLGLYAINSVIYTGFSTTLTVILAMMAAFGFAKLKFKISKIIYNLFLIGLLISIHSILVPLFIAMTKIGLNDTHLGIIIVYTAINLPLAIYIATEFVKAIPDSIIESATIDGASYIQIFFRIILPMSKPVVTTIVILTILACWNEFILVFILTSSDFTRSLPVGIYMFSGPLAIEYGMQFAALVIGVVPLVIFYILFNKKITKGIVAGAVKE